MLGHRRRPLAICCGGSRWMLPADSMSQRRPRKALCKEASLSIARGDPGRKMDGSNGRRESGSGSGSSQSEGRQETAVNVGNHPVHMSVCPSVCLSVCLSVCPRCVRHRPMLKHSEGHSRDDSRQEEGQQTCWKATKRAEKREERVCKARGKRGVRDFHLSPGRTAGTAHGAEHGLGLCASSHQ